VTNSSGVRKLLSPLISKNSVCELQLVLNHQFMLGFTGKILDTEGFNEFCSMKHVNLVIWHDEPQ
jgi:hypothetical protein